MDSQQNDQNLSSTLASSDISPAVENNQKRIRINSNRGKPCPKFGSYTTTNDIWPTTLDPEEIELVIIKVGRPHHGNVGGAVEKIPKAEAICRCCFNVYKDDMLQTKCKCGGFTMIHESCAAEWSQNKGKGKCNVCEQDIQMIPITVPWDHSSTSSRITRNKGLKLGSSCTRTRFWGYFCFSF